MPHDVIMPALGMAQDSAVLVAWHKAPGDAVKAADILMEVETDKSTMEVEAGHDGFIAELRAEAGDEVPVGDVIAVISAEKPDAPSAAKAETAAKSEAETAEAETEEAPPAAAPAAADTASTKPAPRAPAAAPAAPDAASGTGRILASPKARRLAAERGLDLARLRDAGVPQPYHAADIDTLGALPGPAPAPAAGAVSHLSASAEGAAFEEFLAFAEAETGAPARAPLLAAFAAAALRPAQTADGPLTVAVARPAAKTVVYADPDRLPRATPEPLDQQGAPSLIVRDLTATRVNAMRLGTDTAPVLTLARAADGFGLALDYRAGALSDEAALMLLDGFAARLETPLRQLL